MRKKLLSKHGETLTEALVAILIVALSAAMLATMITTSVNINLKVKAATDELYEEISAAETGSGEPVGENKSVIINGVNVPVDYYGTQNGLVSYAGVEP